MQAAVAYIRTQTSREPRVAVVLGSGLGAFAEELSDRLEIPYAGIPGWPASTAIGHAGKLVFGQLDGLEVAVMAGRSHLYEGYTPAKSPWACACCTGWAFGRSSLPTPPAASICPIVKERWC